MYDQRSLEPDTKAILDELIDYHSSRLHAFERRRQRHLVAKSMDGEYSLTRLLHAMRVDRVRQDAPFEYSCSERIAEKIGRLPNPGYAFIPVDSFNQRDLVTAIAGAGGYLVSEELAPGDTFVGALLASSVAVSMGISRLGLMGQAAIPSVTGGISTYWLPAEATAITESQFTFGLGVATPKSVGAYCELSGNFLKQTSPAAQNFVLSEMGRAVAAELDSKIISGSGASGQPLGILNTSGIGSVTGTSLAWGGVLDAIKTAEDANAIVTPERAGWAIAPDAARLLRARERATGNGGFILGDNGIAGYKTMTSNSVPAGTAIFADWSGALILSWGILEIGSDPYGVSSALFKTGMVGLRALWSCDIILLRPKSFVKVTGIT